jgi:hypothetical protein
VSPAPSLLWLLLFSTRRETSVRTTHVVFFQKYTDEHPAEKECGEEEASISKQKVVQVPPLREVGKGQNRGDDGPPAHGAQETSRALGSAEGVLGTSGSGGAVGESAVDVDGVGSVGVGNGYERLVKTVVAAVANDTVHVLGVGRVVVTTALLVHRTQALHRLCLVLV